MQKVPDDVRVRPHPDIDRGARGQFAQSRLLFHVGRLDQEAVGQVASEVGGVRAAEQRFATDGFEAVGAEDQVGGEVRAVLEMHGGGFEVDACGGRVEEDGHAETLGFLDEDPVVVGAVDVQVWRAVLLGGVEGLVGPAENVAGAVGAENEFGGLDGHGLAFGEEVPAFEDAG